jgi:demethylmenaquinone methyltransferase/2-methoxy-6-polyprenyl-1,4-benzoquinol methylase
MSGVTEDLVAEQKEYYRRRAAEYDITAYGDLVAARQRIARIVRELGPAGSVLEIACGTGLWTEALAERADTVLALDSSPEALAIARARVPSDRVLFEVVDVFSWAPPARFDVVFFAAWLSHVPARRFDRFWALLGTWLADGGRVLFVDEPVAVRDKERFVAGADEVVERRLVDCTCRSRLKIGTDPADLGRWRHPADAAADARGPPSRGRRMTTLLPAATVRPRGRAASGAPVAAPPPAALPRHARAVPENPGESRTLVMFALVVAVTAALTLAGKAVLGTPGALGGAAAYVLLAIVVLSASGTKTPGATPLEMAGSTR